MVEDAGSCANLVKLSSLCLLRGTESLDFKSLLQ